MSPPFDPAATAAFLAREEEARRVLEEAAFIVWTDYGVEGWKPDVCATEQEVTRALTESAFGRRLVTKPCRIVIRDREE